MHIYIHMLSQLYYIVNILIVFLSYIIHWFFIGSASDSFHQSVICMLFCLNYTFFHNSRFHKLLTASWANAVHQNIIKSVNQSFYTLPAAATCNNYPINISAIHAVVFHTIIIHRFIPIYWNLN